MFSAFSRPFESKTSSHFDRVLAALEEIILSPEFDEIDNNFMEQHCDVFELPNDDDMINSPQSENENKLEYTKIFKQYEKLGDETLTKGLKDKLQNNFNMEQFNNELIKYNKDGCLDEIQEMLKCFTDFIAFKEKILDFKRFKNGMHDGLGECLVIGGGSGSGAPINGNFGVSSEIDIGLCSGDNSQKLSKASN